MSTFSKGFIDGLLGDEPAPSRQSRRRSRRDEATDAGSFSDAFMRSILQTVDPDDRDDDASPAAALERGPAEAEPGAADFREEGDTPLSPEVDPALDALASGRPVEQRRERPPSMQDLGTGTAFGGAVAPRELASAPDRTADATVAPEQRSVTPAEQAAARDDARFGLGRARDLVEASRRGGLQGELATAFVRGADAETIADIQQRQRDRPTSDFMRTFSDTEGFADAAGAVARDPAGALIDLAVPSAVAQVKSGLPLISGATAAGAGAGAALGSVIPGPGTAAGAVTGGVLGFRAGSAGAGATLEYAHAFMELLEERGVDTTDAQALERAFNDQSIMAEVRAGAAAKAAVIGGVDFATFGIANKLFAGPAKSIATQTIKGSSRFAVEVAGEGAGEALAQVAQHLATGHDLAESIAAVDSKEVLAEVIGGIGMSAAQTGVGLGGEAAARKVAEKVRRGELLSGEELEIAHEALRLSGLHEYGRPPEAPETPDVAGRSPEPAATTDDQADAVPPAPEAEPDLIDPDELELSLDEALAQAKARLEGDEADSVAGDEAAAGPAAVEEPAGDGVTPVAGESAELDRPDAAIAAEQVQERETPVAPPGAAEAAADVREPSAEPVETPGDSTAEGIAGDRRQPAGMEVDEGAGDAGGVRSHVLPDYTRDDELRASFEQRGPAHQRIAREVDGLIEARAVDPLTADAILAHLEKTNDAFLGRMRLAAGDVRDPQGVRRAGVARINVPENDRGRASFRIEVAEQLAERAPKDDLDVQPLATVLHEFMHAGERIVLNDAQRKIAQEVYESRATEQWAEHFREGVANGNGDAAQYAAGSFREWFAAMGVEYALGRPAPSSKIGRLVRRVFSAFRRALRTMRGRAKDAKLRELFDVILAGEEKADQLGEILDLRVARELFARELPDMGPFGPVYRNLKNKRAVRKLLREKQGEAPAALHHPAVGDIDLVYGVPGTAAKNYEDGFGLAHIEKKHPEVLPDLQAVLDGLEFDRRLTEQGKVVLTSRAHVAAIRLDWNDRRKTWLVTAYEKGDRDRGSGRMSGVPSQPSDPGGGRPGETPSPPQSRRETMRSGRGEVKPESPESPDFARSIERSEERLFARDVPGEEPPRARMPDVANLAILVVGDAIRNNVPRKGRRAALRDFAKGHIEKHRPKWLEGDEVTVRRRIRRVTDAAEAMAERVPWRDGKPNQQAWATMVREIRENPRTVVLAYKAGLGEGRSERAERAKAARAAERAKAAARVQEIHQRAKEAERATRERLQQREQRREAIRAELAELVNTRLPASVRGKFITAVRDATTFPRLLRAARDVEAALGQYEHRQAKRELEAVLRAIRPMKLRPEFMQAVRGWTKDLDISEMRPSTRRALRATARFLNEHGDHPMPPHVVRSLERLNKRSLASMSKEEIEAITNAVRMAIHLSRVKNRLIADQRGRDRDEVTGQVLAQMHERIPARTPGRERGKMSKFLREGGTRPEVLMEALSPELRDLVWENIGVEAHRREMRTVLDEQDALRDAIRHAGEVRIHTKKFEKWRNEPVEIQTQAGPKRITRDERTWLITSIKDPSNRWHILNNGITIESLGETVELDAGDLRAIEESASKTERAISRHMHFRFNGALKHHLNGAWLELFGYHIARVPDYVPRKIDMDQVPTQKDPRAQFQDMVQQTLQSWQHLIERVGSGGPLRIGSAMNAYMSHVSHVAQISSYLAPVRDAHSVIEIVKPEIIRRVGRFGYQRMLDAIHMQTVPPKAIAEGERFMRLRQQMLGTGILGLRATTIALNPAGMFIAATYHDGGFVDLAAAIQAGVRPGELKRIHALASEHSPYWRMRYQNFSHQVTSGIASDRQRSFGSKPFRELGLVPLEWSDVWGGAVRWKMAERYITRTRPELTAGGDRFHAEVAKHWERMMYRSENTGHGMEMTGAIAKGKREATFGLMVLFQSSASKVYSAGIRAYDQARIGMRTGDKAIVRAGLRSMAGMILSAAYVSLARDLLRVRYDDEDEWPERMAGRFATEVVGLVPIFGQVLAQGVRILAGKRAWNAEDPVSRWQNDVSSTFSNAVKAVDEAIDGEIDREGRPKWRGRATKAADGMLEVLGAWFGLPYSGGKQTVRSIMSMLPKNDAESLYARRRELLSRRATLTADEQEELRRVNEAIRILREEAADRRKRRVEAARERVSD